MAKFWTKQGQRNDLNYTTVGTTSKNYYDSFLSFDTVLK